MTRLRGHDGLIADFLDADASCRLHHAWLLAGPQGVGKAKFADAVALRLLADAAGPPVTAPGIEVPPEHRIAKLIDAGSHPDFQRLERQFREKTGDYARNITIDQVRGLQGLFGTTPTFSPRRVVVIDSIDDLERSAANALLKSLEEPPPGSLFLLVSHSPGRLLRFPTLDDTAMTSVLRELLPEADDAEIAALVAVGEGSPGRALRFSGLDVRGLDEAMARLIGEGDPTNAVRSALARSLALKSAQPRYEAFLERAPARIAAHARKLSGQPLASAIAAWEQSRALADSAVRLSLDPQTTVFELAGLMARLAPTGMRAKA